MRIRQLFLLAATGVVLIGSSCQSRKIAYGNSYYFKATPRELPSSSELYATVAPVSPQPLFLEVIPSTIVPPAVVERTAEPTARTRREARQERRAQRKAIRQQLKQWLRTPPEVRQAQVAQRVEGLTKAGIITGAAGLVMLLIGVLASVSFLTAIGGIILAIAVVLILLDVL